MFKLLIIIALTIFLCLFPAFYSINAQNTWTTPIQVDDSAGLYPAIHYLENGDLLYFYNSFEGTKDYVKMKKRNAGDTVFSQEVKLGSDGRWVDVERWNQDSLFAVYEDDEKLRIYMSTNEGQSWSLKKTYNADEAFWLDPAYGKAFISKDQNEMHVGFKYVFNTGVFGTQPYSHLINFSNGAWQDDSGTNLPKNLVGLLEFGDTIAMLCSSSGNNFSIDNGATFTAINGDNTFEGGLYPSDVDYHNGKIHLVKVFNSTTPPYDLNLHYTSSEDKGQTWLTNQIAIFADTSIVFTSINVISTNDTVHIFWINGQDNDQKISHIYSVNQGLQWSTIQTILELSGDEQFEDLNVERNGSTIGLSYALKKNNERYHVYLMEMIPGQITHDYQDNYVDIFKVFPNPVEHVLYWNRNESASVFVYNYMGQLEIYQNGEQNFIDVHSLKPGIYFMKVMINGKPEAVKFLR